jgi:hypothetical protein
VRLSWWCWVLTCCLTGNRCRLPSLILSRRLLWRVHSLVRYSRPLMGAYTHQTPWRVGATLGFGGIFPSPEYRLPHILQSFVIVHESCEPKLMSIIHEYYDVLLCWFILVPWGSHITHFLQWQYHLPIPKNLEQLLIKSIEIQEGKFMPPTLKLVLPYRDLLSQAKSAVLHATTKQVSIVQLSEPGKTPFHNCKQ